MIREYITDINTTLDKIQIGKRKAFGMTYYKIPIYNPQLTHPQQKFWFMLPKVKIVSNNNNNNNITIALSGNDHNAKFIDYIKCIETKIKNIVSSNIKSSFVKKNHHAPTMSVNLLLNTPIFDENDSVINISNITDGKCVSCFIELSEVLVSDDNNAWIIWNFLQIKLLDEIDFKKSMFSSMLATPIQQPYVNTNVTAEQQPSFTNYSVPIAPPMNNNSPISQNKSPILHTRVDNKPKEFQKLVISQSVLLEQINKLKKKKLNTVEPVEIKVSQDLLKGVTLNKTITREPLPLSAWYNKAKEEEMNFMKINKLNIKNELESILSQRVNIKNKLKSIYDKYDRSCQ